MNGLRAASSQLDQRSHAVQQHRTAATAAAAAAGHMNGFEHSSAFTYVEPFSYQHKLWQYLLSSVCLGFLFFFRVFKECCAHRCCGQHAGFHE